MLEVLSPEFDIWELESNPDSRPLGEASSNLIEGTLDFALLVASPLILLVDWLKALGRSQGEPPEWESLGKIGPYQMWVQTLMDSNEFPTHLDLYDQAEEVYALFRFRFAPALEELETHFFYEEMLHTPRGLYILSYNAPGEGMTLWHLPQDGTGPIALAKVRSCEWELEGEESGGIQLTDLDAKHPVSIMVIPRN